VLASYAHSWNASLTAYRFGDVPLTVALGLLAVGTALDHSGLPVPLILYSMWSASNASWCLLGSAVAFGAVALCDHALYWVGRHPWFAYTYGSRVPSVVVCVMERAEALVEARVGMSLAFGRFAIGIGKYIPFVAGKAGVPYARFCLWNTIGAAFYVGLFALLAFHIGSPVLTFARRTHPGVIVLLGLAVWMVARVRKTPWRSS
jgi:membrane protein DedA with SNARE-associated domain